jgi:hypothetical protein
MEKSKELVKKAGIIPQLQLAIKIKLENGKIGGTKSTGPHKVKVLEEKVVMGTDYQTGQEREEMKYILEENGEKKSYNVPVKDKQGNLHYLIQRFAEVEPEEEVVLEARQKGIKTYISLERLNPSTPDNEEMPTINEEEPISNEESGIATGIPVEDTEQE